MEQVEGGEREREPQTQRAEAEGFVPELSL